MPHRMKVRFSLELYFDWIGFGFMRWGPDQTDFMGDPMPYCLIECGFFAMEFYRA